MEYKLLNNLCGLNELKALPEKEIYELCNELRSFLIEKVGKSGGHLASNLGVTELSVAIHRVFDSPKDHIIFDVGHQAYVHKILTGRKDNFDNLRRPGGLSGFTLMRESEHDAFGAGHSSTSVSAALGYAESDKLLNNDSYTVCVLGDGAYTGGMVHEAINNLSPDLRLVIILNENGMSISTNRGAFASYLSGVRISKRYVGWKNGTLNVLNKLPLLGKPVKAVLSFVKNTVKKLLYKTNYFEELGFYYLGPIDGNDYKKVERALLEAKRVNKTVIIHLKTTKGKGLGSAESSPESFHSIGKTENGDNFHSVFANQLINLADKDEKVLGITAAMGIGTGLNAFEQKYPERYFDVGIAEGHALTFAAGLAANGFKPYTAIYSTFMQRGYDSVLHDIALQGLPVRMLIDRAGLAVSDGATHHGIFDVAFLSHIPGIEIIAPASYSSLKWNIDYSASVEHPIAIRYANASQIEGIEDRFFAPEGYEKQGVLCDFDVQNPPKNIYVTYGNIVGRVLEAKESLLKKGLSCGIVLIERIKPYESACGLIASLIKLGCSVVYAEEGIRNGGAAMITETKLIELGVELSNSNFRIAAIDDNFVSPDEPCDIYDYAGLSANKLIGYFTNE